MATQEQRDAVTALGIPCTDDAELSRVLDRHSGNPESAALEVIRRRRAELLSDPAKHSLGGEISEDWTVNLKAWDADIARLEALLAEQGLDPDGSESADGLVCGSISPSRDLIGS